MYNKKKLFYVISPEPFVLGEEGVGLIPCFKYFCEYPEKWRAKGTFSWCKCIGVYYRCKCTCVNVQVFTYYRCKCTGGYITGVTQEQIDETRLSTEVLMLKDLQKLVKDSGDLEFRGRVMETPVSYLKYVIAI